MTTTEKIKLIGTVADWKPRGIEGVLVSVRILDITDRFGRLDVLVEPVTGSGKIAVSMESLSVEEVGV